MPLYGYARVSTRGQDLAAQDAELMAARLTWNGLMAPAGTPRDIVDKIAAEIGRAVKDRQFAARLEQYGADPLGNTPAEFSAMVAADTALWADTIQSLGLKF